MASWVSIEMREVGRQGKLATGTGTLGISLCSLFVTEGV